MATSLGPRTIANQRRYGSNRCAQDLLPLRGRNGYRQSAVDVSRPMTEGDQEVGDDTEPEDPVEQWLELAGNEFGGLDADHEAQESENDRQAVEPHPRRVRLSGTPVTGNKGHREPRGDCGNR